MSSRDTANVVASILQPAFKNKFKVTLGNRHLLAMQVTRVEINMMTSEVIVMLEQPAAKAQEFIDSIRSLALMSKSGTFEFRVDLMGLDDNVQGAIAGAGRLVEHLFQLDYASADLAEHKLRIKYTAGA